MLDIFFFIEPQQIAPDNLKRGNVVRFSDEGLLNKASNSINNVKTSNNERTPPAVAPSASTSTSLTINDYLKESKTLNVNVLVDDDEEMNNEIRFVFTPKFYVAALLAVKSKNDVVVSSWCFAPNEFHALYLTSPNRS